MNQHKPQVSSLAGPSRLIGKVNTTAPRGRYEDAVAAAPDRSNHKACRKIQTKQTQIEQNAVCEFRASGGAEHCQMGAQTLWHADFFDWMSLKFCDDKLAGH